VPTALNCGFQDTWRRVFGMVDMEKKSLKGIEIRQPRAERSATLGIGVSILRALKGHNILPEMVVSVEPLQGSVQKVASPRATLRSALGYRMSKPFRLGGFCFSQTLADHGKAEIFFDYPCQNAGKERTPMPRQQNETAS
jgi:hypothetical protein